MLYHQLFIDAIADTLSGTEYRLLDDSFYIYKREIGIVIKATFDVFNNASEFRIYGGASAFCERIKSFDGHLAITCYDLNEYALRCGLPQIDNVNPLGSGNRRYKKEVLAEKLQQNMELFRKSMLADLLGIESLEDYYNFAVKAYGTKYSVAIPFPEYDTFFLSISLGKFKEASHIYLRFLKNMSIYDSVVEAINDSMHLALDCDIFNALDGIDMQANTNMDAFDQFDKEAEVIESILRKHETILMDIIQYRVYASRIVCDRFFAAK